LPIRYGKKLGADCYRATLFTASDSSIISTGRVQPAAYAIDGGAADDVFRGNAGDWAGRSPFTNLNQ
jgi:hypothetical protein